MKSNQTELIQGLVSVITPMYNGEHTIEKTIISVLNQTYTNWEMIIVDDCSCDRCAEIVKKYSEEDSRIKYYKNDTNLKVAETRNRGISFAKGQYIAFLDSDDIWYENKLELQLNKMRNEGIAFCYSACGIIDEEDNKSGKVRNVPLKMDYNDLLKGNEIPCLTVVLDRLKIGQVKMPQIHHEDYATWLNILKTGVAAYGINEPLADYRVCRTSLSGNKFKAMGWTWSLYRDYLKLGMLNSGYCFVWYLIKALKKRN